MILHVRHSPLFALTWLTIMGVACTERVSTAPTAPTPTSSPSPSPNPTPPANCTYEVSPTNKIHGPGAETGTVSVTALSGCAWTASTGESWITVTSGSSGTGSGTVGYAVAVNGGAGRTGTLTVAGRTVTVDQAVPACRLADIGDVSRWTVQVGPSPGTVRVSGQRVELRAVTGQVQAGIVSPCALQGDFDVQVDYALTNWPAGNPYGLRLLTLPRAGGGFGVYRTGAGNYSLYLGPTPVGQSVSTSDTRGQLRLARTGASISGYFSSGSGWTNLGSANVGVEPFQFVMDLSSANPSTPSELIITFENFRINLGTPAN